MTVLPGRVPAEKVQLWIGGRVSYNSKVLVKTSVLVYLGVYGARRF